MISNSFADKLMAVWQSSRLCPKYIKTIIAHRRMIHSIGRFNLLHIAGDK